MYEFMSSSDQYRDEHGELWINVFDGVFKDGVSVWRNLEPAMGFQCRVVFGPSFGMCLNPHHKAWQKITSGRRTHAQGSDERDFI